MLVGGLTGGERAFVRADHMPPLPLELMVMFEWECCVVRVKSGLTGLRSMWRMCCVLGRPVNCAMCRWRYGSVAPMGKRHLCFCPSTQTVIGMDLGGWCELMWKGEKIGGSDVVATVMGEEWLRWVMMKLGSRVVCDWERRWREGGCCVREEARNVMS